MFMSFFSLVKKLKGSNKESYSLVFNLGSGSVAGGIIKFTEETGVNIVHYDCEVIPFQQEISVSKHLDLMGTSLTALAKRIQIEGLKKIGLKKGEKINLNRVFYIFSSPWSVSQTKTIRVKEVKAFRVTEDYLNKIIGEQEKSLQSDVLKAGKIIERKIIQMKVNGYTLTDVYDRLVKDLEISVFLTVVPEEILQIADRAIAKVFNIKNVWCHSLSLALLSVIRNIFPQEEDFISIDISEEITDISIVKDNILATSVSLPFGRNHFIRELSQRMSVTEEIADSMIKTHCLKANDKLAALKLSVAMDQASANWIKKIFEVFDGLKEKIYVPETVFLVANLDFSHFLKDKMQKHDFEILLVDNKNIKSSLIQGDLLFKLSLMFLDNIYKI